MAASSPQSSIRFAGPVLYQFGPIQFSLVPLNLHEFDHITGSAYARKEVIQATPQREWMGEEDEQLQLRGRIFPEMFGGFDQLEAFDAMRRAAQAHMLIRGGANGYVMGWFVCERLIRHHRSLGITGIGREVTFETTLARCDTPMASGYYADVFKIST